MKSLKVFLPHITTHQIEALTSFDNIANSILVQPLTQDWQSLLCDALEYPANDLPWTQLRVAQFKLKPSIKTVCCCDPVMLQMTHRGAYMMGQAGLELSHNDAIRIVAQINERLMEEGQYVYLVDKYTWLFMSEEVMELPSSPKIQELIGKDIFDFSYHGKNKKQWQQLATEIQMLLKQMQDYQGLQAPPPEMILNVHFFDCLSPAQIESDEKLKIPFIKRPSLTLISDNDLMKTFCMNTLLQYAPVNKLNDVNSHECVVVAFDNEKESYPSILQLLKKTIISKKTKTIDLYCQNAHVTLKTKPNFFKRFLFKYKN